MTFWLNGRTLYAIITSKARCAFEFFIHFNLSGLCTVSAVPKCRLSFLAARVTAKRRVRKAYKRR